MTVGITGHAQGQTLSEERKLGTYSPPKLNQSLLCICLRVLTLIELCLYY
jgi:hypothetical protein